jgi:hypothetical protein
MSCVLTVFVLVSSSEIRKRGGQVYHSSKLAAFPKIFCFQTVLPSVHGLHTPYLYNTFFLSPRHQLKRPTYTGIDNHGELLQYRFISTSGLSASVHFGKTCTGPSTNFEMDQTTLYPHIPTRNRHAQYVTMSRARGFQLWRWTFVHPCKMELRNCDYFSPNQVNDREWRTAWAISDYLDPLEYTPLISTSSDLHVAELTKTEVIIVY